MLCSRIVMLMFVDVSLPSSFTRVIFLSRDIASTRLPDTGGGGRSLNQTLWHEGYSLATISGYLETLHLG